MWCYWRESSYFRSDHASVSQPHGVNGEPSVVYWLASPPWFGDLEEDRAVQARRFRTPESAMDFADRTWPEGAGFDGVAWWRK